MDLHSNERSAAKRRIVPGMFSSISDAALFSEMLAHEAGEDEQPKEETIH